MRFYGRDEELKLLKKQYDLALKNKTGRLVVVSGRRRIGKTTLITKAYEDLGCRIVYLVAEKRVEAGEQLASWTKIVAKSLSLPYRPAFDDVSELMEFLFEQGVEKPLVVIVDECQEMERTYPAFWTRLQRSWDLMHKKSSVVLVMSGSAASAVRRIFSDASEPLYGRTDLLLEVGPFDTGLLTTIAKEEFPDMTSEDLLTLYAMTGGVARYVEYFADNGADTTEKMIRLVFSREGAWFQEEGNTLLANEFRMESPVYRSILNAVARGANEWGSISQQTGAGDISIYLSRLENLFRLIEKRSPLNGRLAGRGVRFYLADQFFKFWYRFVDNSDLSTLAARSQWEAWQQYCLENWPTYTGRILEDWFLAQFRADAQWDLVGPWWDRRGQNEIDIVAVSKREKRLLFAEVKRNEERLDLPSLIVKANAFVKANGEFASYRKDFCGLSLKEMSGNYQVKNFD